VVDRTRRALLRHACCSPRGCGRAALLLSRVKRASRWSSPRRPLRTTSRRPRTTNRRRLAPASVARQLLRLTIEFQATRQRLGRGI